MKVGSVRFAWAAARPEDFPRDGKPEVCVLGRSNVGKSSLMNRLLNRTGLARVSKTPGRTREIHFYVLDERYYLVDLPGFGYANVPEALRRSWAALTESYFSHRPTLALARALVDVRHHPPELDQRLVAMLAGRDIPFALVLTKADKVSGNQIAVMRERAPRVLGIPADVPLLVTSSATGAGMKELSQLVVEAYTRPRRGGSE